MPARASTIPGVPIEVGIWRIDGDRVDPVPASALQRESRLEDVLERDISILGLDALLIVGRQVITKYGSRADLVAIDVDGTLYVIELKRNRTPREVVAQALDYGYWVRQLDDDTVGELYARHNDGQDFEDAFVEFFDQAPPSPLNDSHQLIIVASELDASTERIVGYAADYDIPLNVVFFQYFKDGAAEYLTRSWLIDPAEAEERSRSTRSTRTRRRSVDETWNGTDYHFSGGEGSRRNWDDMVRYGFISAGGKPWYSNTLKQLDPGKRVFAHIPGRGYVGVGIVTESVRPVTDFQVETAVGAVPILDASLDAPDMGAAKDDAERREYVVRVQWLKTRPREDAFWKPGMYANQNSVTRLRQRFTLEELYREFGVNDDDSEAGATDGESPAAAAAQAAASSS